MSHKVAVFFVAFAISAVLASPYKQNSFDDFSRPHHHEKINREPTLKSQVATATAVEKESDRRHYLKEDDVPQIDKHAFPKYVFKYGVDDKYTGDKKFQYEERNGDVVKGHYKILDPDGYIRVVEYTADKDHGFNAVVTRTEYVGFPPNQENASPKYPLPK